MRLQLASFLEAAGLQGDQFSFGDLLSHLHELRLGKLMMRQRFAIKDQGRNLFRPANKCERINGSPPSPI